MALCAGGIIMQNPHQKDRERPGSLDSPLSRWNEAKTVPEREDALDDALDDTFPASDPVSTTPQPPVRPKRP
jgi:hypothetical protein